MSLAPEDVPAEAARRSQARGDEDLAEYQLEPGEEVTLAKLQRWSFIEVDPSEVVYSTRRLGQPITALKRGLVRLLGQHLNESSSQATRFNVHLLAYVAALEDRIAELERRLEGRSTGETPGPPGGRTEAPAEP